MNDADFVELGREMLAVLRETCLSDQATMSTRTGLADAEQAYAALERFLEPRTDVVSPDYRDMNLAAAALFIIGADQATYLEMMVGLDWSGDDWNLATVAGAWRAGGFLSAVGDDNDYSIDASGSVPRVGYQWSFDHFLPTLHPASMHDLLRGFAEEVAAGPSCRP